MLHIIKRRVCDNFISISINMMMNIRSPFKNANIIEKNKKAQIIHYIEFELILFPYIVFIFRFLFFTLSLSLFFGLAWLACLLHFFSFE
jgi:hypothetical protein